MEFIDLQKIFVDSSFWITIFLTKEMDYEKSARFFKRLRSEGHAIFTSNDVIDEVVTRLVYKNQFSAMKKFVEHIQKSIDEHVLIQLWVDDVVQEEAFRLVKKFYEHRLSLTDATSVALMERFRLDAILSLDDDFGKVGIKVLP